MNSVEAFRSGINGARIAMLGIGRSGLAVAGAVHALGGQCVLLDQAAQERLPKPDLVDKARELGAEVHLSWDGSLTGLSSSLLVVNPAVRKTSPVLDKFRSAGIEVISEIEFAYRISMAPIIAVTGTNGKSTTTVMVWQCLSALGFSARLCGNIYGSGYREEAFTDAALNAEPSEVLAAEISSFQLELVQQFRPRAAVITNITADHLNSYSSEEEYALAKTNIFRAQTAADAFIYDADDSKVSQYAVQANSKKLTIRGSHPDAIITSGFSEILGIKFEARDFPFSEAHNFRNAAMAALAAASFLEMQGKEFNEKAGERILQGLQDFRHLSFRMQPVGFKGNVQFINNSMCTNPAALASSLNSLSGRVHALVGGDSKGLDFSPVKSDLSNPRFHLYFYGTDGGKVKQDLGSSGPEFESMQEAFQKAVSQAVAGDTVILSPGCASNDQFRDFTDRGNVFSGAVKEWLES